MRMQHAADYNMNRQVSAAQADSKIELISEFSKLKFTSVGRSLIGGFAL
jgi:hypothetical protein